MNFRGNSSCPAAGQAGGEALVGRLVAKRFGSYPELFKGKVGYYAPRLCPQACVPFVNTLDTVCASIMVQASAFNLVAVHMLGTLTQHRRI